MFNFFKPKPVEETTEKKNWGMENWAEINSCLNYGIHESNLKIMLFQISCFAGQLNYEIKHSNDDFYKKERFALAEKFIERIAKKNNKFESLDMEKKIKTVALAYLKNENLLPRKYYNWKGLKSFNYLKTT